MHWLFLWIISITNVKSLNFTRIYLSPGLSCSFGFCSHGTLQLNGETSVFAIKENYQNWQQVIKVYQMWPYYQKYDPDFHQIQCLFTYISTLSTLIPHAVVASSNTTYKKYKRIIVIRFHCCINVKSSFFLVTNSYKYSLHI